MSPVWAFALRRREFSVKLQITLNFILDHAPKFAFYSPGAVGLGHIRRNMLIANKISREYSDSPILLISESKVATMFPFPRNVDCVSLPSIRKDYKKGYSPRNLPISIKTLFQLRKSLISDILLSYAPDVFIVDYLPCGLNNELLDGLSILKYHHPACKIILGLRDVIDSPEKTIEHMVKNNYSDILNSYYSEIWVYGDKRVYDTVFSYKLDSLTAIPKYSLGYLDPSDGISDVADFAYSLEHKIISQSAASGKDLILCLVGGGQDGLRIGLSFLDTKLHDDSLGLLIAGPFMDKSELSILAAKANEKSQIFILLKFSSETIRLMRYATRVISMAGYNAICEILTLQKPALLLPRSEGSKEQQIRSLIMERFELADVMNIDALTPDKLSRWLIKDFEAPLLYFNMNGLDMVLARIRDLLGFN